MDADPVKMQVGDLVFHAHIGEVHVLEHVVFVDANEKAAVAGDDGSGHLK